MTITLGGREAAIRLVSEWDARGMETLCAELAEDDLDPMVEHLVSALLFVAAELGRRGDVRKATA